MKNLREVELMIEREAEFDYSLVYGDMSDLMITVDVSFKVLRSEAGNLRLILQKYAKYMSGDDGIISGRMTDDGYMIIIGKALELHQESHILKPLTAPVHMLRYRDNDESEDVTS